MSLYEGVAYPHDILVYGYDLQENLFYVGDHFKSGKFSCYDAMVESLPLLYSSEYPFTRQSLYILQLHKKIMVERLKYMGEHGILQNNEKFIGVYQQVATMIGKLVLKYMHAEMADNSRKTELIPQMEKLLWETKELEAQVLPELVGEILF